MLISQRTSPATTSVIIIVRIGKIDSFMMSSKDQDLISLTMKIIDEPLKHIKPMLVEFLEK